MLKANSCAIGLCALMITASQADSANIEWNGLNPHNDLNTAVNWNPTDIPTSSDNAIFDNRVSNIDLSPSASLTNFSVSEFNFPHAAQPFSFTFDKCSLKMSGAGITGSQTNTSISASNTNNSTPLVQSQIVLDAAGSAAINANNSGSASGNVSGVQISQINGGFSQISTNGSYPYDSFSMLNGGSLTATNNGVDNTSGTGNNSIGYVDNCQIQTGSFSAEDNATIAAHNMGTNANVNDLGSGSNIGLINNPQINSTGAFTAGNALQLNITNAGIDNSSNSGSTNSNIVGSSFDNQLELDSTFTAGQNATITISNSGNSTNQGGGSSIGFVYGSQLSASGNFQTGDSLALTITNSGTSTAGSNTVGLPFGQFVGYSGFTTGNDATINIANNGIYSGNGNNASIGFISGQQFVSSGPFLAGDRLNFTAANSGVDSGMGSGSNTVGYIADNNQVEFDDAFTVGNNATIKLTNSGTNSNSDTNSHVGFIFRDQFSVSGNLQAGDSFSISATNTGEDIGSGIGRNGIGYLENTQIGLNDVNVGNVATFIVENSGTNKNTSDTSSNSIIGTIGNPQLSSLTFQAGDALFLNATNTGIDSSNGSSNNNVGLVGDNQIELDAAFTSGKVTTVVISNSGNSSGTGNGSAIGYVSGNQLATESFQTDDSLLLQVSNSGDDSSSGVGGNSVGYQYGQIGTYGTFTTGNNSTVTITNNGSYSGSSQNGAVGYSNGQQLFAADAFSAGNYFTLTSTNTGKNSSAGLGNNKVGVVIADQVEFDNTFTVGDHAIITLSNSGTNTNSSPDNKTGTIAVNQFSAAGNLQAGDSFSITATNDGEDTGSGNGGNQIGYVGNTQLQLNNINVGNVATFIVHNSGTNSNSSDTSSNSSIGYVNNPQLSSSTFQAGDALFLNATNIGVDSSSGSGSNNVGYVGDNQIELDAALTSGKVTTVVISNSGNNNSSGTNSSIGLVSGNQLATESFQTDDSLLLHVQNSGNDSSNSAGSNSVGYQYGQIGAYGTFTTGNNSTIDIANSGSYSGSGTNNSIGYSNGQQLLVANAFSAGDSFTLMSTNVGEDSSTGAGNNQVGVVNANQVEFDGSFAVGDNASITISSSGTNSNSGVNSSNTGVINGSQFFVAGSFAAGSNLALSVTNDGTNTGNVASTVGSVMNSQINFGNTCTLQDGTFLSVVNNGSGSVGGPQMFFQNGFDLTGNATFQAINQGSVGQGQGISIAAGTGGDVDIILQNNQLFISSSESTFTIGALNGNSTCTVQSSPQLIINTDSGVNAAFAGAIQNFGQGISSLVKSGTGIQTLSGANTFTGPTTVNGGVLILNGSLAGNLSITSLGTLKGIGSVGGNVTNAGVISPGQSIGTLTFLGNFTNNGGDYNVEVNGAGQNDLIDVTGTASINGGIVAVSSSNGTYRFQNKYTIVDAGSVSGAYGGVTAVSSLVTPALTYDLQHVYLTLTTDIVKGATTANQLAVATQLDAIINPNAQQSLLLSEIVSLPPSGVGEALDNLSGYQHTSDLFTAEAINRQFIRRLYDPIRSIVTSEPCDCNPCDILCGGGFIPWLEGGGVFTHLKGNSHVHGFNTRGYEITAGLQKTFCRNWTLGIAGSYEHDDLHYRSGGGFGNSSTWLGGIYGLYRPSFFYGLVDLAYGYSSNSLHRKIRVGELHYSAHSKPKISQYTFYGEVGFDVSICDFLLQPFGGVETASYWRKQIHEQHAEGWQLDVKKRDRSHTTSRLGFHLTACRAYRSNVDISLDFAWNHRFTQRKNKIREHFAEFGSNFEIRGIKLSRNSFDYALTASTFFCEEGRIYIEGSGESWSNSHLYNILAGMEFRW